MKRNLIPEQIKVFSNGEWAQPKEIVIKDNCMIITLIDGQVFEYDIDKVIDSKKEVQR